MATPPTFSNQPGPPAAVARDQGDGLELSAAAKESFGFADDQFMELSTSGASIYDLPILSEPSSSSSGRLNQSGGSSSNGSLRRVLLGQAAAAQQHKTRDESTLSQSGMSLASLGSLSRSARRSNSLYNVDEALDDSMVWREGLREGGGLKLSEDAETRVTTTEGTVGGSDHRRNVSSATGVADHAVPHDGESQVGEGSKQAHSEGFPPPARGAAAMQNSFTSSSSSPGGAGHVGNLQHGRVEDLSARVAELRQQSHHRRLASASSAPIAQRSRHSPPPLPLGVDLAPPESSFALPQHPRKESPDYFLNPDDQRRLPLQSQTAAGTDHAWGAPGTVARHPSAGSDSHDGGASGGGSGGGNGGRDSSGSNNSGTSSSKTRKKGVRRAAAARVFMRTIGMGPNKLAPSSSAGHESAAASAEGDGGSSVTSWSADSSLQGTAARGTSSSPGIPSSPAVAPHLSASSGGGGGGGLGALSESSPASSSTGAGAGGTGAAGSSSELETTERRGGLRERLGQVWSGRRGKKYNPSKQPRFEGDMAVRSGSVVLQPTGGGEVGFAFLPAADRPAPTDDRDGDGLSPAPGMFPDWLRTHSAPVGPAGDEGRVDDMDGSSVFPTTPLGRSNRSFDPNLSPSTYDADGSNVALPPPLGSRAAAEGLGASFDPNRSTRSWFDFSGSGMSVSRHAQVLAGIWQEQPEQLEIGQQPPMRPRPFPESLSAEYREERAAAAAAALAAATTALESSTSTTTTTQRAAASPEVGAGAATLSPALFDEDALVAELSDLSVSDGRRSKRRSQAAAAVAAGGGDSIPSVAPSAMDLQPEKMAQATEADNAALLVAAQQSWAAGNGVGPTTEGEPYSRSMPSSLSRPGGEGAWRSNNSVSALGGGHGGRGGGRETLGSLNDWNTSSLHQLHQQVQQRRSSSGTQQQSAGGAHDSPAASNAAWPASVSSSTGPVQDREVPPGRGGMGAAEASAGGGATFISGVGGVPHGGLGHAPTAAPAQFDRGARAQSVDVGALQQMARMRDGQMAWGNDGGDEELQWTGAWPPQQKSAVSRAVSGPSVGTVSSDDLHVPLPFSQRSVSVDDTILSMSTSRSSRVDDIGGGGSIAGVVMPPEAAGAVGVAHAPQAHAAGPTLVTAVDPPLTTVKREDKLRAPSLPEGFGGQGSLAAQEGGEAGQNHRASWSALHAMIPMPGVASNSNVPRRASDSVVGAAGGGRGGGEIARGGDAIDMGGLPGGGRGGGGLALLGRRKQQTQLVAADTQEMLSKRRLNPSRVLDIFGKHNKKQCLNSMAPPAPTEDPKGNAFEPLDFLRGKFGGSSSSASASSAMASGASGSLIGGSEPTTAPEVAEPGKKTRQAVAARRPRNRGRFMKSQQKWVTQGELKQTKATGGDSGGGWGGGAGEEVALS